MNLLHHFLVAMPSLQDPFFKKSVVYVCEHNDQGAMGIVINHPLPLTVAELLLQLKIKSAETMLECPVFHGGPVATDRGFILHSPQAGFSSSLPVSQQTMLTNSRDILETLGTDQQPKHLLVALGYASWQAGQLERELAENSWLTLEADMEIIYHMPINKRWQQSAHRLGIDNIWQIVSQVGHA